MLVRASYTFSSLAKYERWNFQVLFLNFDVEGMLLFIQQFICWVLSSTAGEEIVKAGSKEI